METEFMGKDLAVQRFFWQVFGEGARPGEPEKDEDDAQGVSVIERDRRRHRSTIRRASVSDDRGYSPRSGFDRPADGDHHVAASCGYHVFVGRLLYDPGRTRRQALRSGKTRDGDERLSIGIKAQGEQK